MYVFPESSTAAREGNQIHVHMRSENSQVEHFGTVFRWIHSRVVCVSASSLLLLYSHTNEFEKGLAKTR